MEESPRIEQIDKDLGSMIERLLENSSVTHLNLISYKPEGGYFRKLPIYAELIEVSKIKNLDKIPNKNQSRVGLSSLVRLSNGSVAHIKQLDLDWEIQDMGGFFQKIKNLKLGEEIGYLVESGKGYHYYGEGLLTPEGWIDWMKKAENSGEVDKDWITCSKERGYSVLRINTTEEKPIRPKPICRLQSSEGLYIFLSQ